MADRCGLPLTPCLLYSLLPANLGSRTKDTVTGGARVGFSGVLEYALSNHARGEFTYYATLSLFSHLFLYLRSLMAPQQAAFGLSVPPHRAGVYRG